ncbi:hypothetical protein GCM10028805_21550 [Spirosoma harenae]
MKSSDDPGKDEPNGKADVLVSEKTEDVEPTGVDDKSTGMGDEGDNDYLAKTNKENKD